MTPFDAFLFDISFSDPDLWERALKFGGLGLGLVSAARGLAVRRKRKSPRNQLQEDVEILRALQEGSEPHRRVLDRVERNVLHLYPEDGGEPEGGSPAGAGAWARVAAAAKRPELVAHGVMLVVMGAWSAYLLRDGVNGWAFAPAVLGLGSLLAMRETLERKRGEGHQEEAIEDGKAAAPPAAGASAASRTPPVSPRAARRAARVASPKA